MDYSLLLSLVPPLVAIVLALISKQVIPSLLIGLWAGSFIMEPGILSSISKTMDYIITTLTSPGNLDVLLFLYAFSGLVAIIELTGGVQGFAKLISKIIKSKKAALIAILALTPITFIDCGFRVVSTGSIMKPIIEKKKISKERFAYMLNNTASPVVALIPIATTFVGYMVGVVASGLTVAGVQQSPYILYLKSIPFNFFSIISIIIVFITIITKIGFKTTNKNTEIAHEKNNNIKVKSNDMIGEPRYEDQLSVDNNMGFSSNMEISEDITPSSIDHDPEVNHNNHSNAKMSMDHEMGKIDMNVKPKPWNLIVPIILIIPLSFYLMWWTGKEPGNSILDSIANAESSRAMLIALFITSFVSLIFYKVQGNSIKQMISQFIKGGNRLMTTIAILAVAWPIASVSKDLGLPQLITDTIGNALPSYLVPVIIFILTSVVTFFIGSSWGTWALIMPLAIPLAAVSGASLPITIGAVFAGGTFGDVSSPLSGMGAMASGIAEVDHMDYITTQMPYNITAAALAALAFLIVPILLYFL
ncbi:MAG: hypothetical protein FH761_11825 [Firmicutes bacterium]|nr:hypothetical protein [Bacillota bacterium]